MVSPSRFREMSEDEREIAMPDSKEVIHERVHEHCTPVDPYEGEWTFWAPGVAEYFATRHEAIAAATITARRGPLCRTIDGYLRKVTPTPPYRCDECHQAYDSREEYVSHLEFYEEYAAEHPTFENKHPSPESV